jgi:hypothetical protein
MQIRSLVEQRVAPHRQRVRRMRSTGIRANGAFCPNQVEQRLESLFTVFTREVRFVERRDPLQLDQNSVTLARRFQGAGQRRMLCRVVICADNVHGDGSYKSQGSPG